MLLQDIRYALRVLLKNPGFTAVAIATLALGIGVNTAIFSVVYGVLLRPLPYASGRQLVVLHQSSRKSKGQDIPFSVKEILDYRRSHTLDQVVEHHSMVFLLLSKNSAERVQTGVVSANFFDVLGVKPLLGRTFVPADEDPGATPVLVLTYKYWHERHGGDPNIVGRVFEMNNKPHTVIGVLPPIPQYPAESDIYMPTSQCPFRSAPTFIANRRARMMTAFGRLKAGVTLQQAQADLSTVAGQMRQSYPDYYPANDGYGVEAGALQDELTHRARKTLLVLLAGAGLVLLIACANVANLLLARLLKLERELAVRSALGATRARLMRQLLTESVTLSAAGGALGLLLAPLALRVLVQFAARFSTRAIEVKIDGPVLLFTFLISIATGLLFGFAPAFSSGRNIGDAMKQGGGRTTSSRARQSLRAALVIAQVAVSFMLLIGAGLMIRSFARLEEVNPGFDPRHTLTLRVSPGFTRYNPTTLQALMDSITAKVRAVPGVESVAFASNFPFSPTGIVSGPGNVDFQIEGRPAPPGELTPQVDTTTIASDYFSAIRQPIVRGRDFSDHDDAKSLKVAIINQAMARHRWGAEDPIGRRITFDQGKTWITIAGVVRDVREYGLDLPPGDELYMPVRQQGFTNSLVVRTASDPMAAAPLVRAAIHDVDPLIAVDRIDSVEHMEYESMGSPRVTTILLSLFAGLALLISACGIAAVMALSVSQRRSELGLRMALGASRAGLVGMVVRQGLTLAVLGTAIGVAGAAVLSRLLSSLLFATSPTDFATFVGVAAVFLSVAAVASFVPARQVTGIDPLTALRQE
jgi:putative ABC transport system permease protein